MCISLDVGALNPPIDMLRFKFFDTLETSRRNKFREILDSSGVKIRYPYSLVSYDEAFGSHRILGGNARRAVIGIAAA